MRGTGKNRLCTPVLAAILVASTGMVGCASTSDLQKLQAQVDTATADAQAAQTEAAEAKAIALQAMNKADNAKSTSDAIQAGSKTHVIPESAKRLSGIYKDPSGSFFCLQESSGRGHF